MDKLNNIVIVDDDDVSNFIYTKVIEATDVTEKITTFIRGSEALDYLKETASQNPDAFPEIIFLDINMPIMNGWQFLENFRNSFNGDTPKDVVLCMLSSSVYQEDINKASDYDEVKEYISKPLTSEIINNLLSKYFEK